MFFTEMTDVVPSVFAWINQGPLTLSILLHTLILLPIIWVYKSEKKKMSQ